MKVHFDSETLSGYVELAGVETRPRNTTSLTADDYWMSEGHWDHFTLPMSLQCGLFPWTTLRAKFPTRAAEKGESYGRK